MVRQVAGANGVVVGSGEPLSGKATVALEDGLQLIWRVLMIRPVGAIGEQGFGDPIGWLAGYRGEVEGDL